MDLWELNARESIRDCLAHYTWSGDSARIDDLALAFCPDGVLEVRGMPIAQGRPQIVAMLTGVAAPVAPVAPVAPAAPAAGTRRIVRHNLANIRFTSLRREHAEVHSYFTVFTEIGLDHYGRYRDTFVPVDGIWLIRHRFVSTDWSAPNSTMAG